MSPSPQDEPSKTEKSGCGIYAAGLHLIAGVAILTAASYSGRAFLSALQAARPWDEILGILVITLFVGAFGMFITYLGVMLVLATWDWLKEKK